MGTVHYLPNAATLRKDFQGAINFLHHQDPVALIAMPEDKKTEFVSGMIDMFLYKIDESHKFHDVVKDAARSNIRLLIASAERRRDSGYNDDKLREQWGRDIMPHLLSVMQIAVISRNDLERSRVKYGLDAAP